MTKNSFNLYVLLLHNPNGLTLDEMKDSLGFKSLTSVQRALIGLKKNKLVTNESYQHRSWKAINVGWFNCPFCDRVIDVNTYKNENI